MTVPELNKTTAIAAAAQTRAAAGPRIKLSSHGFSIDHPDPEHGEALVEDCVTSNQTHYYASGGGPHLSDTGDPTAADEVTMQLESGTWKVAKVARKGTSCPG